MGMKITLQKFGTTLLSRQAGKEAYAAFGPTLRTVPLTERVEVDFSGVLTFAPSWGDEFLTPILKERGGQFVLLETNNPSVAATIEILEQANDTKFKRG